jgi:hypothetical protein
LRAALLLLFAVLAGACARPAPESVAVTVVSSAGPLAPFEGDWPGFLDRLALERGRDYLVLAYLPPANPIDISTPERARRSLLRVIFDQLGAMEAGTTIGHLMVGWQCDGVRGLVSMTGEQERQGQRMLLAGWGLTPMFSTFEDGELVALDDNPPEQLRAFESGRGAVLAAEVSARDCRAARARVADFASHPAEPHRNYSLLREPGAFEGGGCLSFGLDVAAAGGLLPRLPALALRDKPLRAVQLGTLGAVPDGVVTYRAPGHPQVPLGPLALLGSRWDEGPVLDVVTVPDGEAILAAMTWARVGTAPRHDWRFRRMMEYGDPVIGPAADHGLGWARTYPVRRIADPDGTAALVLERR